MANRKLTFSVFTIDPIVVDVTDFKIVESLVPALDRTGTIRARMMRLSNDDDNQDSDFISSYRLKSNGMLVGSFLRLRESSESFLSVDDLDRNEIEINEVIREASENSAGTVKDSAFFAIRDNLLVLTSAHSNKKAFLTYLRWLGREYGFGSDFDFKPVYNTANEIPIKDIKSIQLADAYINSRLQSETFKLKNEVIKSFFSDAGSLAAFDWENIVSATLLVKLKKSELKKQNALDAAMRLTDSEDVVIVGKNGKRIKGSDFVVKVERKIENTENGMYNVPEIEGVMYDIINAVKAGEVVC